jgi:hypothetical protein
VKWEATTTERHTGSAGARFDRSHFHSVAIA